jgi:hypothetical protein
MEVHFCLREDYLEEKKISDIVEKRSTNPACCDERD